MISLLSKVGSFQEFWDKTIRKVEEGERLSYVPISMREVVQEEAPEEAAPTNGRQSSPYLAKLTDPLDETETDEVRKVYNSYLAAKEKIAGGPASLPFEKFQAAIAKQVEGILMKGGATAVAFRVEITDEKVALKARPVVD
jgi:hypothetical protein